MLFAVDIMQQSVRKNKSVIAVFDDAARTCILEGPVPKEILVYASVFSAEFETRGIIHLIGVYKKILASAKVKMCEGERKVFNAHTVELTTPDGEVKQFSG
ncbi:unnamed protein product [Sphagnum jensenii]|uniref:Uncharacterized protein n=1 Tax=Sphagnum jensenii TaxID=128206 RepID=A0ABP1ANK1_9BRYO